MEYTEADVQVLQQKYPVSLMEAKTILVIANIPASAEAMAQMASYGYNLSDLIVGFREIEKRFAPGQSSAQDPFPSTSTSSIPALKG